MRELFEQEYREREKSLFLVAVAYLHNTEDERLVFLTDTEIGMNRFIETHPDFAESFEARGPHRRRSARDRAGQDRSSRHRRLSLWWAVRSHPFRTGRIRIPVQR